MLLIHRRKIRDESGASGGFGFRARIEKHRTFAIADPDLAGALFKIERFLVPQFRLCVRRRLDFDADFGRLPEAGLITESAPLAVGAPGDVDCFDAITRGEGALVMSLPSRVRFPRRRAMVPCRFPCKGAGGGDRII